MTTEASIPETFQAGVHAGYTALAADLNVAFPDKGGTVTRQMVHNWYMRRGHNGFPEGIKVAAPSGKVKNLFYVKQVRAWYETYQPGRGGRRPATTVDN